MTIRIAIQNDNVHLQDGRRDSFSDRWMEYGRQCGYEMRLVDAFSDDVIRRVRDCHGFMWRLTHRPHPRIFAQKLLASIEHGLRVPVFPDCSTRWHYDDKVAQKYLLDAASIPTPQTWVFWGRHEAEQFCLNAHYPLVWKLSGGASSENVTLLKNPGQAATAVKAMFTSGRFDPSQYCPSVYLPADLLSWRQRLALAARKLLAKDRPPSRAQNQMLEFHNNYFYVQEFLPDNPFDTRVTVIGDRAFGFRRFNRPEDFRASGSGNFDLEPENIDLRCVRLAFAVAKHLNAQAVAIDVLYKDGMPVVSEISYTFVSWVVHECPGHWRLQGTPDTGLLQWIDGPVWPEHAILDDFAARVRGSTTQALSVIDWLCGGTERS